MSETLAQAFVRYVHEDLLQVKQPHFDIAFRLSEAKNYGYAEELGYANIYELSEAEFGFKRSSTAAYISVCENFMTGMHLLPRYDGYSFSQLVELLPMDDFDRRQIKLTMTVKQIRQWRKDHKMVTLDDGRCVMYAELTAKEKKELDAGKQRKVDESVQTSGQQESDFEVEVFPVSSEPIEIRSVVQPPKSPLLNFKNVKEREEWLQDYKSWGVWLSVPELNLVCYKYKFANGHELIVSVSKEYCDYSYNKDKCFQLERFHLINDEITFFDLSGIAKTYVLDYMTKYAKEI